jgi:prepilin-type N-terminal cleavage/methylation domain-containing protein/prepilin-type processing-associated H-X9-DG protein
MIPKGREALSHWFKEANGSAMHKRGFTVIELLCAILIITALIYVFLPLLKEFNGVKYRYSCPNNLKHLGLVYMMYENENGGVLPSLKLRSSENGRCADWNQSDLVFDTEKVYPEYLRDMNVLACPNDPKGREALEHWCEGYNGSSDSLDACGLTDFSYVYLGWALRPEDYMIGKFDDIKEPILGKDISNNMVNMLTGLMKNKANHNKEFLEDMPEFQHESRGPVIIPRLKNGVERFFITDKNDPRASDKALSEIVVMYDRIRSLSANSEYTFYHDPKGCNVLYMDAHVGFVGYPTQYPVSPAWAAILQMIDNKKP